MSSGETASQSAAAHPAAGPILRAPTSQISPTFRTPNAADTARAAR
jgi:hypothetical protein